MANATPVQGLAHYVTRWLEWEKDSSWSALGVDWENGLTALVERPLLGMCMTVSLRGLPAPGEYRPRFELAYTDGHSYVLTDDERHAVHEAFTRKLGGRLILSAGSFVCEDARIGGTPGRTMWEDP
ncbi:hypothetical protein [Streptomyces sp. NPDC001401]|uniref:hypothetical protein n=1 Tax=Streptomyces sp. NPDC001401 TaxID=3364570 RepID=UPI00369B79E3